MKKIKVFGGDIYHDGKQRRAIVATTSQKKLAEVTQLSLYEIKNWWCETGNEKELKTALAEPNIIFVADKNNNMEREYKKLL